MPIDRRELLRGLALLAAAPLPLPAAEAPAAAPSPRRRLDVLLLGGTGFLGPQQVRHALARGHRVTVFNRGRSAPGLLGDEVETLIGDRDTRVGEGLRALEGTRRWDIVIDNSGYVPRHVRDSVALLDGRCERYLYVSTVSVYADPVAGRAIDEDAPLRPAPEPPTETVTGATYGGLKAECDRLVRERLGARATVVRPGFIVGPGDPTDRFTYWVVRAARGGTALGPPDPEATLQWVDVRDLAPWTVELAERGHGGVWNAAGPPRRWGDVLAEISAAVSGAPVDWRRATTEALQKTSIELPLVPSGGGVMRTFDGTRARQAGLGERPLAETARATLEWWRAQDETRRAAPRGWPTPAQEREALALLARA